MKVFDAHSDILSDVEIKRQEGQNNVFQRFHLERLKKGNIAGSIFVVWFDPAEENDSSYRTLSILGSMCREIKEFEKYAGIVKRYEDIEKCKSQGKLYILLGMEGLSGLKGNVNIIDMLYELGIRHASLTWNEENEFATGVKSLNKDRGVTAEGLKVIGRMEKLGMVIDVSHANEKTFWDIYENTGKPFIASHSNSFSLCPAPRNLKDEQIKAIAERHGVIGINAYPSFIDAEHATSQKLSDHIDYIVQLIGIDYVGMGFDFCHFLPGYSKENVTEGLEDASHVPEFIELLYKKGYKVDDVEKIAYKNFHRVFKNIL